MFDASCDDYEHMRHRRTNEYHFLTRWRLRATAEEIFDVLSEPLEYPRWWPSVYLSARAVVSRSGGAALRRTRFYTKGWLSYTLRWDAITTEAERPRRIVVRALGDLHGRGIWSIVQDGAFADVTFDWKLTAEKPFLRYLSWVFKPMFKANHRWAMEQGRQSLELELARSRARTVEEMNAVPAPPRRTRV